MPHTILCEYDAKRLFNPDVVAYSYCRGDDLSLPDGQWVVKVDQGIKGRFKKGLVKLNLSSNQIIGWVETVDPQYTRFIIEPMIEHHEEHYVSILATEDGDRLIYIDQGGIGVGQLDSSHESIVITPETIDSLPYSPHVASVIARLYAFYRTYHLTMLEVNPFTETGAILDMAVQYDDTAWPLFVPPVTITTSLDNKILTKEETAIKQLDAQTGGSLKFTLLNPNGSIWTLLAGGGGSVACTDEIYRRGRYAELGNYGEYSGDPPTDLVAEYVKNVLAALGQSRAPACTLFICGAIANFTAIDKTFKGIITALESHINILINKQVSIYVRRGGPKYQTALKMMKRFGKTYRIPVFCYGPEVSLTSIFASIGDAKMDVSDQASVEIDHVDIVTRSSPVYNWTEKDQCAVFGYQTTAIQRMLDFDTLSSRERPSVAVIINPTGTKKKEPFSFRDEIILMPVVNTWQEAVKYGISGIIDFSSFRSVYNNANDYLRAEEIKWTVLIAEGMPEQYARDLRRNYPEKTILGPSTVGGIIAGKMRLGNMGGTVENLVACGLYQGGNVGIVTRSGGLLNELCNVVSTAGYLVHSALSIGGDRYPATSFLDIVRYYLTIPEIKVIILLGEAGGIQELAVANFVKTEHINTPILGYSLGICGDESTNVAFGHAGAFVSQEYEKASFKNQYMRSKGMLVPDGWDQWHTILVELGLPKVVRQPYRLPKQKKPAFFTSISNESKEELEYNHIPISDLDPTVGNAIGQLWFQRSLPKYATDYFEKILFIVADHSICVSTALNCAVTTRAGRDLVSSVCSGLLTIGDLHGGAIAEAAANFYQAVNDGLSAREFVDKMKRENRLISGIGHKIKSSKNPDKRVELLDRYTCEHFTSRKYIEFAREVEAITITKRSNLILNVDGFIGASLLDLLSEITTREELETLLKTDFLNAFFLLGRTIGLIGHYREQKSLNMGLYRLPHDQVQYL